MKYLKVCANDTHELVESKSRVDYHVIQDAVAAPDETDATFQMVGDEDVSIFMNENGKFLNLLANVPVTLFARSRQLIMMDDVVVGDCIIMGGVDDEGYETEVTPEVVAQVLRHSN